MKRIDAVVKVFKLEEIVERLHLIGVVGLTVAEVHGMSPSTEVQSVFHGEPLATRRPSSPRYQLTIVVMDDDAVPVVQRDRPRGRLPTLPATGSSSSARCWTSSASARA